MSLLFQSTKRIVSIQLVSLKKRDLQHPLGFVPVDLIRRFPFN